MAHSPEFPQSGGLADALSEFAGVQQDRDVIGAEAGDFRATPPETIDDEADDLVEHASGGLAVKASLVDTPEGTAQQPSEPRFVPRAAIYRPVVDVKDTHTSQQGTVRPVSKRRAGDTEPLRRSEIVGDVRENTERPEPLKDNERIDNMSPGPNEHLLSLAPLSEIYGTPRTIDTLAEGETVTTIRGQMEYTKPPQAGVTCLSLAEYNGALFPDSYEPHNMNPASRRIAGGYTKAMAPGKTVVDLGSGQAHALNQLAMQHPRTTFIGIDIGYAEQRPIAVQQPGTLQLTKDDWNVGRTLANAFADTILLRGGNIPGGIDLQNGQLNRLVDTICRISKPGTVLRFDLPPTAHHERAALTYLLKTSQLGWEIHTITDKNHIIRPAIVAVR